MPYPVKKALGFKDTDKYQKEIVDGLITKKAIRDSGLGEFRKAHYKVAGNTW